MLTDVGLPMARSTYSMFIQHLTAESAPLPSQRQGAAAVTDGEGERCELNVTQ